MRTAGGKAACIINEPISETHTELVWQEIIKY